MTHRERCSLDLRAGTTSQLVGVPPRPGAYTEDMATREARPATWEDAIASTTDDAVVRWRMIVLLRAGYLWDDALALAVDTHVDLHLAVDLADRGCASETSRRSTGRPSRATTTPQARPTSAPASTSAG